MAVGESHSDHRKKTAEIGEEKTPVATWGDLLFFPWYSYVIPMSFLERYDIVTIYTIGISMIITHETWEYVGNV